MSWHWRVGFLGLFGVFLGAGHLFISRFVKFWGFFKLLKGLFGFLPKKVAKSTTFLVAFGVVKKPGP